MLARIESESVSSGPQVPDCSSPRVIGVFLHVHLAASRHRYYVGQIDDRINREPCDLFLFALGLSDLSLLLGLCDALCEFS